MHSGTRLGPYQIASSIGVGGMGEVFRARDTRLNRDVAIKVLLKDFVSDADRLRRFEQEAKTLAALNHPNVLTIHDAGVHEGAPYLVSELLEGKTLREEMNGGALPLRKATEHAVQIAHGLAAAHGKGAVHRDLKPANIFVTKDGRVKILDFGLAKLRPTPQSAFRNPQSADAATIHVDPDALVNTAPGLVLGTPAYMSPEQVRGESVDHRADIFAFGCVLYEMLSGNRPFKRETSIATMAAIMSDEPPDLLVTKPDLPPAFARVIHRCLEKQPERRFQGASDLAFALEAAGISNTAPKTTPSNSSEQRESPLSPQRGSQRLVTPSATRWARVALLLVAAVGAGWWLVHQFGQATKQVANAPSAATSSAASNTPPVAAVPVTADPKSIAVLAFVNMSADKDNEYFSDGITEEILNALARTPGLRVAARTSAFAFKGKSDSVQRIGETLKVGVVLEGSVRRAGNQLRITAQLINVADGFHLWSDTFDRKAEDVFAIQTEVAQKVQEVLKVKLLAGGSTNATLARTDNLEAYDLYLRGRHFWNQRTGADLERAVGLFQQATEKDPKFAAAYAGLASSYVLLPYYASVPVRESNPKARTAARRALELDSRMAEAHSVLGYCAAFDWDRLGAEQEYQEALRLNPNHGTSHQWYAELLAGLGKMAEALVEIRKAQTLDPLSPAIQWAMGARLYDAGRFDEALAEVNKTLKLSPDFLHANRLRGRIFLVQEKIPAAIAEFEKVRQKTGETPYALGFLGYAYARAGRTNEAGQILEKLKNISASSGSASGEIAFVHQGLGDLDQVFVWLERAVESRDWYPRLLKSDPLWSDVVKDPRYAALLKKFGLDK